ncbi:Dihydropteroate synthase FolP [Methanonatronarchaeum thermophilum]|uniref:Dihydropteroate synthase FolP n=1 Tax=Methanonatronarchaeum thermophilum TaxID=1927129 RepID=A0A1Y3GJ95_9EURY|nr:dihydropteroate synthase-like protein [Methanonatronarchaeum thermophilum]OUJ19466.1 Dihydropteroate synthase FolP [Methanonatronarchaeum thermophilum]
MDKILFVTGKKAFEVLSQQTNKLEADNIEFEVQKLPIDVAAFTTPNHIKRIIDQNRYSWIVVSGLSPHDYSELQNVVKGPKNAYDITEINYKQISKLSPKKPADEVIEIGYIDQETINQFFQNPKPQLQIRDLQIGKNTKTKIITEIVDATNKKPSELRKKAKQHIENGADIIDIGVHHNAKPQDIKKTINTIQDIAPVSLDTMNPEHIETGIEQDIDLILSVNEKLINKLGNKLKNQNLVVLGDPNNPEKIHQNIKKTKNLGANPIADPILSPPLQGLTNSLKRYIQFREKDQKTPLLMGIGNITELIDTDSHSINALMASIAIELDVNLLLTTEESPKTQGSTSELKTATTMSILAKIRGTTPKNLGAHLIKHKEKTYKEFKPPKAKKIIKTTQNKKTNKNIENCKGCYQIGVNRKNNTIYATYYNCKTKKPTKTLIGKNSDTIINKIIETQNPTKHHTAYLSKELHKAETALKTNKNYIQDTPLYK